MHTEELRNILRYDHQTGVLTWAISPSAKVPAGAVAGKRLLSGHIAIKYRGRAYLAHRLAWQLHYGDAPPPIIDHADRDPSNNRVENLRAATRAQNAVNTQASEMRGIRWMADIKKWQARIGIDRRMVSLGVFDCLEAAKSARATAMANRHGAFVPATLNP